MQREVGLEVGVYYSSQDFKEAPAYFVSREEARKLKKDKRGFFVNHGKDMCLIGQPEPLTAIEELTGWNTPTGLKISVLHPGRCGQNIANYPIPYVFDGHLTDPKAYIVNGTDRKPRAEHYQS